MHTSRLVLAAAILVSWACQAAPASRCARTLPFAPWDSAPPAPAAKAPARGLADGLLVFYQQHMRAHRLPGQGCRLRPTCSAFAREAVERYGLFGLVLTADRLFVREHPFMDAHYLPVCGASGEEGLRDPVP